MEIEATIRIFENTPPHCSVPLYTVTYNELTMLECAGWEELKEVSLGELIDCYEEEGRV